MVYSQAAPAHRQGAARGDADGNLWVRTSQMVNGGTVYNVISNQGKLKERILIPPGRVIAGDHVDGYIAGVQDRHQQVFDAAAVDCELYASLVSYRPPPGVIDTIKLTILRCPFSVPRANGLTEAPALRRRSFVECTPRGPPGA
jgi:hypothetical protein